MGSPLTASSDVECNHKGTVGVSSSTKLTVGGNAVLIATGVVGTAISGCLTPIATTPPTQPCKTVLAILPVSQATKLTAGGAPVILDTLAGTTDGICIPPPGMLVGVAGQSKLTTV
jgi:hypothetical protein